MSFAAPVSSAPTSPNGVFGSLEIQTNATAGTSQWLKVKKQLQRETALYATCDDTGMPCPAHLRDWRDNLKSWKHLDLLRQIDRVNAYANDRIQWTSDLASSGKDDRWSTPAQALKGKGDCEDYAITKYMSLKALGIPESALRIVVLTDTRKNIGHAVLSVHTSAGIYILDNQNPRAFLHGSVNYYQPIYSVNADGRWMNLAVVQKPDVAVAAAPELKRKRPVTPALFGVGG
jgi:predicted transglutaminase-like cysteine proteinase